jgi:hypothetical protein
MRQTSDSGFSKQEGQEFRRDILGFSFNKGPPELLALLLRTIFGTPDLRQNSGFSGHTLS